MKDLNHLFTIWCVFPLVIVIGGYLTFRLKILQISRLKESLYLLMNNKTEKGVSAFEAVATLIAGNFGTGNITGMAIAFSTGGPGSLIWMWLMAFLGSILQYASCVLGREYREKGEKEEYNAGPMYVLKKGVGSRLLACIFSLCTIFGAISVGNFAQLHSLSFPFSEIGISPFLVALVVMVLVASVILGGISRFAKVASILVPFKAVLYFGSCLLILALNFDKIPEAFSILLKAAFGKEPFVGGILGIGVAQSITAGFDRGLFATDAGIGIAPILQANTRLDHPAQNGIISIVAPFLVMLVCTATGLVLLVTGVWKGEAQGTNMVIQAFIQGLGSEMGRYIVLLSLFVFAFTTVLSWGICFEKSVEFAFGAKYKRIFLLFYVALIPIGSLCSISFVWGLADLAIAAMLITNLLSILLLLPNVISLTESHVSCFSEKYPSLSRK